jgi:hypothetical protein
MSETNLRAKKEESVSRPPVRSMVLSVAILAFVPALIAFGVHDLPSYSAIRAEHTADIVGVWLITWGLIVLGIVGALTVSWLAWTADAAAERLEENSAADPVTISERHAAIPAWQRATGQSHHVP